MYFTRTHINRISTKPFNFSNFDFITNLFNFLLWPNTSHQIIKCQHFTRCKQTETRWKIQLISRMNIFRICTYRPSVFLGGNESGGHPKLCAQSSNLRTSSSVFIFVALNFIKSIEILFQFINIMILFGKILEHKKSSIKIGQQSSMTLQMMRMWKPFAFVRIR